MKKMVNGVVMDMTAEEISAFNLRTQISFEEAMQDIRNKRNNLLAETDWYANSDVTMSDDMRTYRQALRDITNGLTTVEQVEAVEFPTKPSEE
jgi:hypothetical protein